MSVPYVLWPNSSLVDQQVRASQWATRLLHAATVVEAAEIDRRIAEFGDQALDRLLRRDVVTGDEQHPSRVALSRPLFEVRHGDRVERLDHPRTRCMPGDDNACASALKISESQGIERDEWVRGVDEDSALPIGERVERVRHCGPGQGKQHEFLRSGFGDRGGLGADVLGDRH